MYDLFIFFLRNFEENDNIFLLIIKYTHTHTHIKLWILIFFSVYYNKHVCTTIKNEYIYS